MNALSTTATALKMQFASTRSAATSATVDSATPAVRIITAMVLSVSLWNRSWLLVLLIITSMYCYSIWLRQHRSCHFLWTAVWDVVGWANKNNIRSGKTCSIYAEDYLWGSSQICSNFRKEDRLNNKSSAVADMCDYLATIDIGWRV